MEETNKKDDPLDIEETTQEINKKEQMLKQIDEHIPVKLEPKNETQILLKELSDTKAYLDIVLRDLSEVKQQQQAPIYVKKKKNIWKFVALIEAVVVLSGAAVFGIYSLNQESIPTMKAQEPTEESTGNNSAELPIVETTFLNANLSKLIADYTNSTQSEFIPSVTTLFGFEYLMLSNGEVSVYYRNEFLKEADEQRQTIMIDNGSKIAEFQWDYDFEHGIDALIPHYGDYFATGQDQLIFPLYAEGGSSIIPKQLRSITVHNLLEQESIDIEKQLEEIITLTYEEVGNDVNKPDTRMKFSIGAANYQYAINNEDYINAVYSDEYLVSHEKYFTLSFENDKITITSIPYISEHEYLGELNLRVTMNDNQLVLSNIAYSTYALADQEDNGGQVIIPRTDILGEDRISLWGFNNESYLIELSDTLERNQVMQEDLIEEDNGLKYYMDGDNKSIPGIDVSKFQGEIDWEKVKEAGIEYAIIRVGFRGMNEGTLEIDPNFEANIKGAIKAGIPVGIYFFSQAVNPKEAREEAQFVIDNIKKYKITYPVIIDTEHVITYDARANKLSRQERTNIAKVFCEKVKQSGYQPMIYANTKWMVMGIDLEQLVDYELWYAYYGDELSFPYQFDMLQYSSEGKIPGIEGNVDLNLSLKDYSKQE
jgi:GH25 family lysozyme M1 (1,4-beta-N-acetylmuramidase)